LVSRAYGKPVSKIRRPAPQNSVGRLILKIVGAGNLGNSFEVVRSMRPVSITRDTVFSSSG
jgi:hypothetical protein